MDNYPGGINHNGSAMSELTSKSRHWLDCRLIVCLVVGFLVSGCSMTTSPLHSMIRDGQDQEAIQIIEQREMVNARDQLGYSPLHIAAIRGNRDIAVALLRNGADLNARDFHGRTAFMLALREGEQELARYFLAEGAQLHTNYTLTNALFDAIKGKDLEMTEYLLQHGFSVNVINRTQTTPIHIAAASGNMEIIDLLVQKGAKVDQVDDDGWSALHFAGAQEHRDSVRRLLASGAKPFELSHTPLAAYATGVVFEEGSITRSDREALLIAAEHYSKAAQVYQRLADQVQQEIDTRHAQNALAFVLEAFVMAVQPGSSMPSVDGGTVRLHQPVLLPGKDTTTLQSSRAAYLASMQMAMEGAQRCREAVTK